MRELTQREQLRIIRNVIKKVDFASLGSSRLVVDFGVDKVVKIAFNDNGRIQNDHEVDIFKEYGNEHLATIYAYSPNIIIMEKLDIEHLNDDFMHYQEIEWLDEDSPNSIWEQILVVADYLNDITGWTDDNTQVGFDKNGKAKAFDYGYNTDLYTREQVGVMNSYSSSELVENLIDLMDFIRYT